MGQNESKNWMLYRDTIKITGKEKVSYWITTIYVDSQPLDYKTGISDVEKNETTKGDVKNGYTVKEITDMPLKVFSIWIVMLKRNDRW